MQADGGFTDELHLTEAVWLLAFCDRCHGSTVRRSHPHRLIICGFTRTPDGRGMATALEFIFPYIADKSKWPYKHDVLYWDQWPVRQQCLLLGGLALHKPEYLQVWKKSKADSDVDEVKRNWPLRHPLLWVGTIARIKQARGQIR